jgi:hypothetical protein
MFLYDHIVSLLSVGIVGNRFLKGKSLGADFLMLFYSLLRPTIKKLFLFIYFSENLGGQIKPPAGQIWNGGTLAYAIHTDEGIHSPSKHTHIFMRLPPIHK